MDSITRLVLYLLLTSEMLAASSYHFVRFKQYKHKRRTDVFLIGFYGLLAAVYASYGLESLFYKEASFVGYVTDILLAITMGVAVAGKLIRFIKNRHL